MKRLRRLASCVFLALLIPSVALIMFSWFSSKPGNLGVIDGRLADCPGTPNCVCTQAGAPGHRIDPFRFDGDPDEAMARLKTVVAALPRSKIVMADERYLHVEVSSLIFRFVDDVEFLVDPATKTIQFRSASRTGRSDLGVNRQRMEDIRRKFAAK